MMAGRCWGSRLLLTRRQPFSLEGEKTMSEDTNKLIVINSEDPDKAPRSRSYTAIPRFWIDEFLQNLPPTFIKYLIPVWRQVSVPQTGYRYKLSRDSFRISSRNSTMWKDALSVSGVIEVRNGKWTKKHDQPTEFIYDPKTTHNAWRAFFTALPTAYEKFSDNQNAIKKTRIEKHGRFKPQAASNFGAFKVAVAFFVDEQRKRFGLQPVNQAFLADACEGKITDEAGRPIAKKHPDGIEPQHYELIRKPKPGEDDDDYVYRVQDEEEERAARGF
jgi:hypothetical protein